MMETGQHDDISRIKPCLYAQNYKLAIKGPGARKIPKLKSLKSIEDFLY